MSFDIEDLKRSPGPDKLGPDASQPARFTFCDATDRDLVTEQYQHDLSVALYGSDRLIRSEIYPDQDGSEHPSRLVVERVGN